MGSAYVVGTFDTKGAELRYVAGLVGAGHPVVTVDLSTGGTAAEDVDVPAAEVARHRRLHAERLALYRRIEQRDFPDPAPLSGRSLHQHLVLRGGIRTEQAMLDWCDEILAALAGKAAHEAG